jgi:hypothetical protein
MLTLADKTSHAPRRSRRKLSPLAEAIEAHRAAMAAAHADPEDDALAEAASDAEEAVIGAPCASDAGLVQKLAHLLGVLREQWGREPGEGGDFDPIAVATAHYLESRKAA